MRAQLNESNIWHPYTRRSQLRQGVPLLERGEGIWLIDSEGNRFLDATSSWWCCSLGHSHPSIVGAIQEQASVLQHSILGALGHPQAVRLARRLAELMPTPDRHVHFAADGASSVEIALKVALQYHYAEGRPEKIGFASLRDAYHGDTLATVGLGFLEDFHRPFKASVPRVPQLPVPDFDVPLDEAMRRAETFFQEHGPTLAAFIAESLCQGAGGMRIYSPRFYRHLADLCRDHQVVFIADEIATGFYRTGTPFGFMHADVDPDLVCVGKALTAGALPMSAMIAKDSIYDRFQDGDPDMTFFHGHTFAGNPLAAAAANAALTEYETEAFQEQLCQNVGIMDRFMTAWEQDQHPYLHPRHLGMIAAVNIAQEADPEGTSGQTLRSRLLNQGILVRPLGRMTYLMPPLVISETDFTHLLTAWKETIMTYLEECTDLEPMSQPGASHVS